MTTSKLKGPAIFLAQGYGKPGWENLAACAKTAAGLGYKGLQAFLWNGGPVNLDQAAASKTYCDELQGTATQAGCPIVEVANHCDTQLVSCCPAHLKLHQWPAPAELHGNHRALEAWAQERALKSVSAAHNFGFKTVAAFSGSSIFHLVYPWPQRPKGLVEAAFNKLAKAWLPVFNHADKLGVDICFELHPGEDLMDGDTFEMFLRYVGNHPRCKILLDLSHMVLNGMTNSNMYDFIRRFKDFIRMMHVKEGELNTTSGGGVYSSYHPWPKRQGRFRSLGDGQIDYALMFKLLQELQLDLWATVEWEDCAGKGWAQGVREGALYVRSWMDGTPQPAQTKAEASADGAFDDFAAGKTDPALLASILGIDEADVNTNAA